MNGHEWQDANKADLMQHVARIREGLARLIAATKGETRRPAPASAPAAQPGTTPYAVETLAATFGLSPFERDVVVLCAAIELDSSVASLCRDAHGQQHAWPTFGLALAALDGAHWSALTPAAPLRRWRLIEIAPGDVLTASRLQIDERVLHYLTGVSYIDARLQWLIELTPSERDAAPAHVQIAERVADVWRTTPASEALPVIQLCGEEGVPSRRAVAARACAAAGMRLFLLDGNDVPQTVAEREAFARLWERESALTRAALLIEADDVEAKRPLASLIETTASWFILSAREPRRILNRPTLRFDVARPPFAQQLSVWRAALGTAAADLDGAVETLAAQFALEPDAIDTAIAQARATEDADLGAALWRTCRAQARTRIDELAQRIEPAAAWDDLVLPDPQKDVLRVMAAQVKRRSLVYEDWGFAAKSSRGLGISALFHGPSGTGKTMAAEVLARELDLDLYRIDLSQVVNKYIGETEKNLRRVFDAADAGGAILLFDEADTLFGKRSEVKDSHDRYANIEVGYLLQRMESYRGLAILTTNLKSVLDSSFLRRIRFAVQFAFPDMLQRAEIWRRVFPAVTPTEGLDVERLARLSIAGGNIRNIALQAAFLAAATGEPVRMQHVARAAQIEYAKLEKSAGEIGALA